VAIRVKGLAGTGLHTENRVPCGASNPYVVGAAPSLRALSLRPYGIPQPHRATTPDQGARLRYEGPTQIPARLETLLTS